MRTSSRALLVPCGLHPHRKREPVSRGRRPGAPARGKIAASVSQRVHYNRALSRFGSRLWRDRHGLDSPQNPHRSQARALPPPRIPSRTRADARSGVPPEELLSPPTSLKAARGRHRQSSERTQITVRAGPPLDLFPRVLTPSFPSRLQVPPAVSERPEPQALASEGSQTDSPKERWRLCAPHNVWNAIRPWARHHDASD